MVATGSGLNPTGGATQPANGERSVNPRGRSSVAAPQPAEIGPSQRVVGPQPQRGLVPRGRLRGPAGLLERGAEVDQRLRIVGPRRQRRLEARDRLRGAAGALEQAGVIEERQRVAGREPLRGEEVPARLGGPAERGEVVGQVVAEARVLGREPHRRGESRFRPCRVAAGGQRLAEVGLRQGVAGREVHGRPQLALRLGPFAGLEVEQAPRRAQVGVPRVAVDRRDEDGPRIVRAPEREQRVAEVVGRRGVVRPELQRPGQYSFNLGVTQEVLGRLTLTGEWYHNRFTDITERNNVLRNRDSYTPVDVVSPLDGTPASRAGLLTSDVISRIGEVSTVSMPIEEAVNMLRGPEGSKVTIWVERKGWPEARRFTLTRERIKIESVEGQLLSDNVGYIKIKNFQQNTGKDLEDKLKSDFHRATTFAAKLWEEEQDRARLRAARVAHRRPVVGR